MLLALLSAFTQTNCTRADELPSGPVLTEFPNSPIIVNGPDTFDLSKVGPRVVLMEGPTTYKMWYEAVPAANQASVGYATSSDGITWTKLGVVLSPSAPWEGGSNGEVSPNSILFEGGIYKMWYHSADSDGPSGNRRIGYATSPNGLNWTKLPDPVLDIGDPGAFDDNIVAEPRVFHIGNQYIMLYWGEKTPEEISIGRATSPDGIVWSKDPVPVLTASQPWESGRVASPGVIFDGETFHLWYSAGTADGIGYASSTDSINWVKFPDNPVFTGASDSISTYRDGSQYRVLYGYFDFQSNPIIRGVGMATVDAASVPPNVPANSQWGIAAMTLMILTTGILVLTRRKGPQT